MNFKSIILLVLCVNLHAKDEQKKEKRITREAQHPITVINLNVAGAELNQLLSTLQQTQTSQSTSVISQEKLEALGNSLSSFIYKYKYWIPASSGIISYCLTYFRILEVNNLLNSKEAWCNWKNDTEFVNLLTTDINEISTELNNEIQKKYTDPANPTNMIFPMVNFINKAEAEIKLLQNYIKTCEWINFLGLKKIFPHINEANNYKAKEKINKLTYLKNIFSQWSVEFKQNQLKK